MPVMLGGPKARAQRVCRGGIVVSQQYVNGEPALVLFASRPRTLHPSGFVICLSAAFKYADDEYLVQQAKIAAEIIGIGTDSYAVWSICRAINDSLVDLVFMKPEPAEHNKPIGEGLLLLPNGKSVDFELTDEMLKAQH